MNEPNLLAGALVILGSAFMLLAGIGLVRMPDLYTRMQSATKAGTLGVALIALGVGAHFAETNVVVEAVLIVAFLFLTAPIASHLIARAAYHARTPVWSRTTRDDLADAIDHEPPPTRPRDNHD
jgi:multicomponent Na+:H+ antiporter subunit G